MGSGIAQVCAQAGFHTILFDLNPSVIDAAKNNIRSQWDRLTTKGKWTQAEQDKAWQLLHFTSDLQECLADVFIEAILHECLNNISA